MNGDDGKDVHTVNQDSDENLGEPTAAASDDSSEEPEEDEEEARRIREGFIVDEDEDDEESDEDEARRSRRRKRRRRHREQEDVLEEDDIDLLEENTGKRIDRQRLTRIRRIRDSESPPAASTSVVRGIDLRQDSDEEESAEKDIERIWEDDDRQGAEPLDDEDMDMDDFIDDDEQDEGMAEEEREERRKERKRLEKERHRALGARPELTGIDAMAWDEIYEVFGDGTDYDWALDDDDVVLEEEMPKADLKYSDVFEPSEIRERMLTDEDDVIRLQDRPERMQLVNSTLSSSATPAIDVSFSSDDLDDAAHWITLRLSERHERDYFRPDGQFHGFLAGLISAVRMATEYMFIEHLEVPYIFAHRRDYVNHFDPDNPALRVEFLRRDDLWRVYNLGRKYQALAVRRRILAKSYERLQVKDDYFDNRIKDELDGVESVADATEWLALKYRSRKNDEFQLHFHDDEDSEVKKRKLPSRTSNYEIVKKSIVSKLADDFGMKSHEIVVNYRTSNTAAKEFFVEDQDLPPQIHAEAFGDPNQEQHLSAEYLLQQARMLIATELGKDPLLRKDIRERLKRDGLVSVSPSEKGLNKIDEHHPYYLFKYLRDKPVKLLLESPQFLHMLVAEAEHLISVSIELSSPSLHEFESSLIAAFSSDSFSDTAKAWNEQRATAIREAIEKHLLPLAVKWVREWIREEAQENLAKKCGEILRERINCAGFKPFIGERFARVVAVSWGKGDPQKDAITLVYLDENGTLRDNIKVDNFVDEANKEIFAELIARREPKVVVVGGFSIHTTRLVARLKELLASRFPAQNFTDFSGPSDREHDGRTTVPIVYGFDEVARMYQHSKRAAEEFSALSLTAKYCIGIARYTQNPLTEYAALGEDLAALTLDDEFQNLVCVPESRSMSNFDQGVCQIPKEKLLLTLERALVDVVNEVGVDINRAVTDPYYKYLLPFVSGLGPRKAQVVIKKIALLGGNLINREQFIRGEIMTTRIFENAAGFLRIPQNPEFRIDKGRSIDESELPDPLDDTRVHPEDYELARKMAADALDLDEEDIQDEHSSHVVLQIMQAPDGAKRLDELNLDDFAVNMYRNNQDLKRHTLNAIRDELLTPFADRRKPFRYPTAWDVLTMLTAETPHTLRVGLIVSVVVTRIKQHYVVVRLDSGLEGVINTQYLADQPPSHPENIVKKGQTLLGVVIDVKMDLAGDTFGLELSSRQADISGGDANFRKVAPDEDFYDLSQAQHDKELLQRRKRSENSQARRVIKHPNFHNFNSFQAEAYLAKQQRGDAIVRPSSKGPEHLAVTWKVDDGLFQHIDVMEPNADPSQQTVGRQLIIDNGKYEFADLDELIVNHVQALARRVDELTSHEKYKRGTDESIRKELDDYVAANPTKSIYCFTLNRKRPGHFNLVFKANVNSPIQTWPVRVAPEAYYLFETMVPSVPELCDAFKYRHLHQSNLGGGGGKTPFGGRTPGHITPGHRTPGHAPVRQSVGRTPYTLPAPSLNGDTALHHQSSIPSGLNPQRHAVVQSTGNWGGSGGW